MNGVYLQKFRGWSNLTWVSLINHFFKEFFVVIVGTFPLETVLVIIIILSSVFYSVSFKSLSSRSFVSTHKEVPVTILHAQWIHNDTGLITSPIFKKKTPYQSHNEFPSSPFSLMEYHSLNILYRYMT